MNKGECMFWVVLVVFGLLMASVIAGQASAPGSGSNPTGSGGAGGTYNCDPCREDRNWYFGLKKWRQALLIGWWGTRWAFCKAKGCF